MPQTTLEIFDEKRITYKGKNPDLNINCIKEDEEGITIDLKINLTRHSFDNDCDVFFQSYDNRGAGTQPKNLGKIKELNEEGDNVFQYNIPISKKKILNSGLQFQKIGKFKDKVIRLIGKAEIPGFDDESDKSKQKLTLYCQLKKWKLGHLSMLICLLIDYLILCLKKDAILNRNWIQTLIQYKSLLYTPQQSDHLLKHI